MTKQLITFIFLLMIIFYCGQKKGITRNDVTWKEKQHRISLWLPKDFIQEPLDESKMLLNAYSPSKNRRFQIIFSDGSSFKILSNNDYAENINKEKILSFLEINYTDVKINMWEPHYPVKFGKIVHFIYTGKLIETGDRQTSIVSQFIKNGNLYYQVTNFGIIKKVEIQNGNTISSLITLTPAATNIAFSGNTLFYGSPMGISYVTFTGVTPSNPTSLYVTSQNTPDSPASIYAHGGYLYVIMANGSSNTSKVVRYNVSDLSLAPVDVITGIPTTNTARLFVDASQNIYYLRMDTTLNRRVLDRFTSGQGTRTIDDGRNGNFLGIDVDALGNVYYTSYNANTTPNVNLYKISGASTLSTKNVKINTFSISPNPAKDFVTISNVTRGAEVSLYDMAGKLLYSTKANGTTVTLNTSSYQSGVYMVKVDGQTTKLIISK